MSSTIPLPVNFRFDYPEHALEFGNEFRSIWELRKVDFLGSLDFSLARRERD